MLFLPFYRQRRDVHRRKDIPYGPDGKRQTLDIYRRSTLPSEAPVLIHLHGGHHHSGHKSSQSMPLLQRLASHGWVCLSANYRLRPGAGFLDHLSDAKRVIAWVHEHGDAYGADPSRIFLSGSSAGGYLAALCGLTQNDPRFQNGLGEADTSVTAAICLGAWLGGYVEPTHLPTVPTAYIGADAAPFLVVHGERDTVAPVEQARHFVAQLRQASVPVVYIELPGARHAFDLFHSPRLEASSTASRRTPLRPRRAEASAAPHPAAGHRDVSARRRRHQAVARRRSPGEGELLSSPNCRTGRDELEQVGGQAVPVGGVEPVRCARIHPQPAPAEQSRCGFTGQGQHRAGVGVAMYDEHRDVDRRHVGPIVGGEHRAGARQLHRQGRA